MRCPLQEIAIKYIAKYPELPVTKKLSSALQLTAKDADMQIDSQPADSSSSVEAYVGDKLISKISRTLEDSQIQDSTPQEVERLSQSKRAEQIAETKLGEQQNERQPENRTVTSGTTTSQGREQVSDNITKPSAEGRRQDKATTKIVEPAEVESELIIQMRAELATIKADTNMKLALLHELSVPYHRYGIAKSAQLVATKLQDKYANEIDALRKNLARIPEILDKQLATIKGRKQSDSTQRLRQEEVAVKQANSATNKVTEKLKEATSVEGLAKRKDDLRSVNNMAAFTAELEANITKNKKRIEAYNVAIDTQKQEEAYEASIGGQLIDAVDTNKMKSKEDVIRKYNATNPLKVKVPMKAKTISENHGLGTHFTFNGKGVDTTVIGDLLQDLEPLNTKELKPLKSTLETVGKLISALGSLERSDKIATMTEDYHIAYDPMAPRFGKGFKNVSRLMMSVATKVVPNGNTVLSHFEINKDVKTAIALGFVDWLGTMAAPMRAEVRSEADTNRLLQIDSKTKSTAEERARVADIDGTVPTASDTLGAAIWDYLGLKAKRSTDVVNRDLMQANMKTELGLLAMLAAEEAGLVTIEKGVLQTKLFGYTAPVGATIATYKVTSGVQDGTLNDEIANTTTGNGVINSSIVAGSQDIAKNILNTDIRVSTGVYWSAEDTKVDRDSILNEGLTGELDATTTEMQRDAIEKQNADGRVFNNRFTDGLKEVGIGYFAKVMGYTEGVDATVHKEDRAATHGKNLGIQDQLKYYQEALLESEKRNNAPMYAKWYIMSNNRFGIKSNTFNWQDKKLHRHSVEKRKVLIAKDSVEEQVFKLGIAQAMDVSIDKQNYEKSMEKLQRVTNALDKILDASPDNKVKVGFEYMVNNGMAGEPELALLGLVEYIAYKESRDAGTKFYSGMTIETDAITSGYILKILQMPVFTNGGNSLDMGKVYRELARGGVLKESEKQAYGEWRSTKGNKDSYEVPAELTTTKLKDTMVNSTAIVRVNVVMDLLGENLDKGISRGFMKKPFMTLNYGSAITTIIDSKAREAEANIYKLLTKAHTDTGARQELVRIMEVAGVHNSVIHRLKQAHKDKGMLEFDMGAKNIQLVKDVVIAVLKDPLTEMFNEQYGDFIKATKTINSSFQMMFRAAEPMIRARMDAKLEELGAYINGSPRSLTNSEIKEVMQDLVNVLPIFKMAFADNSSNIGLIAKRGKGQYDTSMDTNDQAQGTIYGVGDGNTLNASTTLYKMVESYTGGAPITVHFMDAMIQAAVLSKIESIGVHDANILDVVNAVPGTRAYNEAVAKLAETYSLTTEILSSMNSTMNTIGIEGLKELDSRYKSEAVEFNLNRALSAKNVNAQVATAIRDDMREIVEALVSDDKGWQSIQLEALREAGLGEFVENFNEAELQTATAIYTSMRDLQRLSEDGRYELLNNKSLYIEHSALAVDGASVITEAKAYEKQVPEVKLSDEFNIPEPVEPAKAKTKEGILSDIEAIHTEFNATKEADGTAGILGVLNKILKGC